MAVNTATVPTALERNGDFGASLIANSAGQPAPVQIFSPFNLGAMLTATASSAGQKWSLAHDSLSHSQSVPLTDDAATTIVAIFGTTISPYLFFWQSAQEVEEVDQRPERTRLLDAPKRRAALRQHTAKGFHFAVACRARSASVVQIRCSFAPGMLEKTCSGPVKSNCVTFGNRTRPI